MERAVIIAKGEVQGVGYRGVVFKIARKLNLVGYVENIKPYDVRIIAEGEKENLDTFIEQIKLEEDPILVEEVEVTFEAPTGEFEYFEIRRGDMTEELGERLDLARYEMKKLHQAQKDTLGKQDQTLEKQDVMIGKQDQTLEKQDMMIGKQDQTISIIKSGVDETREFREENKTILQDFHRGTIQRFDNLDTKYGKIAENMERILEELKEERKEYRESIEKLVNAIIGSRKGGGGAND